MKKEEVISSVIMCIVCGLVLVGFTIAWFTQSNFAVVTGLQMAAEEINGVKVSLESGGIDITELDENGNPQYACFGTPDFENVSENELGIKDMAPGTYGVVTFYVTPEDDEIKVCDICPKLLITQSQDGSSWYPDLEEDAEAEEDAEVKTDGENAADGENGTDTVTEGDAETDSTLEYLYGIAQKHIRFYSDEDMTKEITAQNPIQLTWTEEQRDEIKVPIYWKWDYEYPFNGADEAKYIDSEAVLTANELQEKKALILKYDYEDMELGRNISGMKFHFTFKAK